MDNNYGKQIFNNIFAPQMSPQFNPQFSSQNNPTITTSATSTAESSTASNITITVEIRDLLNGLQGDFNDLKGEVGEQSQDFNEQCEKVSDALEKLDASSTKDDITKSGALKKIERFLLECNDPQSKTGKLLTGVKYAASIVKDLASKYNKIAKWVALPQLPFGDS